MSKNFNIQIESIKDKVYRFALKILNNSHEDAQDVIFIHVSTPSLFPEPHLFHP